MFFDYVFLLCLIIFVVTSIFLIIDYIQQKMIFNEAIKNDLKHFEK